MRSVDVDGLDIDSHDLFCGSLFVNGVDVVPLADAELNRQFPGRKLQKAQTPEGLRDGWVAVQSAWHETVAGTPPDLVDAHVEEEWSLAQPLRHLILATDAWLRGGIRRTRQPLHETGQILTDAAEMGFDMSIFRVDPPAYEEILAGVRRWRSAHAGGQLHDVRDRWQERLGMTAAEFTKALAGVDPEELAFTGLLAEAQYTARLARALGQPIARADEFMADMCGELDAELFADVASLRPR